MDLSNERIRMLMTSSDSYGCGFMRVKQPAEFLKQHFPWTEFNLGFPRFDPRLYDANIITLQRANNEFFQSWIPRIKETFGTKIVSDMDDNLWAMPATNLAHRDYPKKELDKLDFVLRNSDALTCSTVPLAEFLRDKFKVDPIIIPNMHHTPPDFIKPKNNKLRIGWHGSHTHNGDFDHHLVKAIRELKKKYDFEFHTFGFCPQFFKDIAIHTEWADFDNFIQTLIGINLDIGIVVATDNHFNKCKSNLKFIEYSLAKVASVAHSVYPYATTIEDGVDGFLVKKEKTDWKSYLEELIVNEELRRTMVEKANKKVTEQFTFEGNGDLVLAQYNLLFERLGF